MNHFGTLPGEAQVSSRLDESTVFIISPGSFLDPILAPFWTPFGTQGTTMLAKGGQEGQEGGPKGGPKKGSFF